MLDFEIKQEVLPVININFEEMKQALTSKMEEYKGIVVTEESLSLCKADQKDLAGIRNKIDTYRKEKKKDLSKPIAEFEEQCKQLIALIEKSEQPIKEGIAVFDNKKRDEKRDKALEIIKNTTEAHQLKEKYACRLTILDKYLNLTASVKSVKEDIEQRAYFLVEEQHKEEELLQTIQTTLDNANKTIKTPITMNDIKYLINMNTPLPVIIDRINQMAEKIRIAEMPKPEPEPKKEFKEDIPRTISEPSKPSKSSIPLKNDEIKEEPLYFIKVKVIGTKFETSKLGNFLRENNYNYEVIEKGIAKEGDN